MFLYWNESNFSLAKTSAEIAFEMLKWCLQPANLEFSSVSVSSQICRCPSRNSLSQWGTLTSHLSAPLQSLQFFISVAIYRTSPFSLFVKCGYPFLLDAALHFISVRHSSISLGGGWYEMTSDRSPPQTWPKATLSVITHLRPVMSSSRCSRTVESRYKQQQLYLHY